MFVISLLNGFWFWTFMIVHYSNNRLVEVRNTVSRARFLKKMWSICKKQIYVRRIFKIFEACWIPPDC